MVRTFNSSVLVAEVAQELGPSLSLVGEIVGEHEGTPRPEFPIFRNGLHETPPRQQNISITKESDGNINSAIQVIQWEKLLNDALQITTATPPLSISEGAVLYLPKNTESRVNAQAMGKTISQCVDL